MLATAQSLACCPLQELEAHAALHLGSKPKSAAAKPAKAAPAIELRLRLHDVAFVMQHHKMEVRFRFKVPLDVHHNVLAVVFTATSAAPFRNI